MNINEIARLAGVSRATVSRYLNNGYVSEEKKAQIKQIIEETGYEPSAQARQLRGRQTKMIGVILPKINSESVSRMAAGISRVLSREGYQLLLGNTDNHEKEEIKYMKLFEAQQVDGIILIGTVLTKEHLRAMKETGLPVVVLGQRAERFSCVCHDDRNAARELTECLLRTGRELAYIGVTERDAAAGRDRRQGFLDALEGAGRLNESTGKRMLEAEFTYESGYEKARELMEAFPETDSVFCATDSIAVGALMYLREKGIAVPKRVQLAGIGDTLMGRTAAVSLTTVHYYYKTSGAQAAELLLGIIRGEAEARREIKLGYRLIIRSSTRGEA